MARPLTIAFCAGVCLWAMGSSHAAGLPPKANRQDKNPPAKTKPARSPEEEATEELGRLVAQAANDHALLVRNLEAFLKRFPNHPRKSQIYRALVEALLQLGEGSRALEYAERLIAQQPDDSSMMLLAVDLLERMGDERSVLKAVGYTSRVLDRVEKSPPGPVPAGFTAAQWELEQKTMRMSVLLVRGRLLMRQRDFEKAAVDFAASYAVLPNVTSQVRLGEIAELRGEYPSAIQHYLAAFVMPVNHGAAADRPDVRRKLGNVWRLVHGSEEGLGERMLSAYDELAGAAIAPAADSEAVRPFYEADAKRPGGAPFSLGSLKGRVVVLVFCEEWSLPCRELRPALDAVAAAYPNAARQTAGAPAAEPVVEVLYVASSEDELGVARINPLASPVIRIVSEELQRTFRVAVIPTVIVLDAAGNPRTRWMGYSPDSFASKMKEAMSAARAPVN